MITKSAYFAQDGTSVGVAYDTDPAEAKVVLQLVIYNITASTFAANQCCEFYSAKHRAVVQRSLQRRRNCCVAVLVRG